MSCYQLCSKCLTCEALENRCVNSQPTFSRDVFKISLLSGHFWGHVQQKLRKLRWNGTFFGPTNSQSIAMKEFWFNRVEFEVLMCGGICVKFLAANFPGNCRTKINEKLHQNFAAFFISLLEICSQKFHPNFALGNYGHNILMVNSRSAPNVG